MLACMPAYCEVGYVYPLCSDHVPRMTDEVGFGRIGRAYNHGYSKAMVQAVNSLN